MTNHNAIMLIKTIEKNLQQSTENYSLRQRYTISERDHHRIYIDNKLYINFASNDYLNLATHPDVKRAYIKGVEKFGLGSTSSAVVAGFYHPHQQLEERLAEFLQRERVILFNSGYHANLGVLSTFAKRDHLIIADKFCHASLLDGIQLSRAKHSRYKHHDLVHAEKLLKTATQQTFLITESVFSMEGDITPVQRLAKLAEQYQATLIVDDAHGIGVLGGRGRGICEHFNLSCYEVPCLITPLGKALGSMGAVVSGSNTMIEALLQYARSYRYTTALPPALALATIEAVNKLDEETWRIEKLRRNIQLFQRLSAERKIALLSSGLTAIKIILVGNNQTALRLKDVLYDNGFFVSCIRPPTVAKGTARIRISLNCAHEEHEISQLLDIIAANYADR